MSFPLLPSPVYDFPKLFFHPSMNVFVFKFVHPRNSHGRCSYGEDIHSSSTHISDASIHCLSLSWIPDSPCPSHSLGLGFIQCHLKFFHTFSFKYTVWWKKFLFLFKPYFCLSYSVFNVFCIFFFHMMWFSFVSI